MKAPDINFVPPRRLWPGWWLLLAAIVLMAGVDQARRAWSAHRSVETVRARVEQDRERAQQQHARDEAQAARAWSTKAYTKDAQDASRAAAFPLDAVMASVESVQIIGVRLVSMDIAADAGLVKSEVEATDSQALLRYVQAINAGEPIERWRLVRTQGGRPGTFAVIGSLESQWTGAQDRLPQAELAKARR